MKLDWQSFCQPTMLEAPLVPGPNREGEVCVARDRTFRGYSLGTYLGRYRPGSRTAVSTHQQAIQEAKYRKVLKLLFPRTLSLCYLSKPTVTMHCPASRPLHAPRPILCISSSHVASPLPFLKRRLLYKQQILTSLLQYARSHRCRTLSVE